MIDPIRELKLAKLVHHKAVRGDPSTLGRLRRLPDYRGHSIEQLRENVLGIRRRAYLTLLARELGFLGWPDARAIMGGAQNVSDFGTLLYPQPCGGHLNLWYRRYDEAVCGRDATAGYLLAYRRDFMVVDRLFIDSLGLDPEDPDWHRLGFDWVRTKDMLARTRLYGALLARRPREASHSDV